MGRIFMTPLDDPFAVALREIEACAPRRASSSSTSTPRRRPRRSAMGWHLDGRVTAVAGTHTHVQTADERILPKGTAYLTDAGHDRPARLDHRRHRRGGARPVRHRHAGEVRGGHRRRPAQRRHRHGRSGDRQGAPPSSGSTCRRRTSRRSPSRRRPPPAPDRHGRSLLAAVRGRRAAAPPGGAGARRSGACRPSAS